MFDKYTEKARRAVFCGRYEASQFASPYIETEHLLLGFLRADKASTIRFLRSQASAESIRKQIEAHSGITQTSIREKTPRVEQPTVTVDIPLSKESKRVLAYAAEEAERLSQEHIGTEHLLLGLLREEKCFAAEILHQRGLRLKVIREELAGVPAETGQSQRGSASVPAVLLEFSRDLTQAALNKQLDVVVEREAELQVLTQVLCRRRRSNPVLVGEPGVGRTAIVEDLAVRIAYGDAPLPLANKRVLALDPLLLVTFIRSGRVEQVLKVIMYELMESSNFVIFLGELYPLAAEQASQDAANVLKFLLSCESVSFIGIMTPWQQRTLKSTDHWIDQYFCPVKVPSLAEVEATQVLLAVKGRYENFHAVSYTDEAVSSAVHLSNLYIPDRQLPGKALELLDDAGAHARLKATSLPAEVLETQKRLRFIGHRLESAVRNREFEKAKSYSEEEGKERVRLGELRERHDLKDEGLAVVTGETVLEVLAQQIGAGVDILRQQIAATAASKKQTS